MPEEVLRLQKVGEIEGRFFIPRYQRGYRWKPTEVQQLLEDIESNGDKFYCLQPVVVRPNRDGEWELIDGQQRMTTLFLVYQYFHKAGHKRRGPFFSIRYETREKSEQYLQTLDPDRANENIDYHHLSAAFQCIKTWFESKGIREEYAADLMYRQLFDHVNVIWYEPETDNVTELFRRLNVGRIPLTNAELVKALLLSKAHKVKREHEIAAQWDAIERDLRRPEIWSFVGDRPAAKAPTRISMLLDALAGGLLGPKRPRFYTFNALRPEVEVGHLQLWQRVVDLHATVMGWFEDNDVFHKVGFLVANGTRFSELHALSKGIRKTEFAQRLDERIQATLGLRSDQLPALRYDKHSEQCEIVLFLMNVESVRRIDDDTRYPFHRHAKNEWSLEHIHAQNTEGLAKQGEWLEWLQLHRDVLRELPTDDGMRRDALVDELAQIGDTLTRAQFDSLFLRVNAFFTLAEGGSEAMHGLANLALLARSDNSSLNNAAFEVKRRRVLDRDRSGSYIPICTRRVFLKYYSDPHQMHFWSTHDRREYLDAIHDTIEPYLSKSEAPS